MKLEFQEQVFDQHARLLSERPYAFDRLFVEGQVIDIEGKQATVISCKQIHRSLVVTRVHIAEAQKVEKIKKSQGGNSFAEFVACVAGVVVFLLAALNVGYLQSARVWVMEVLTTLSQGNDSIQLASAAFTGIVSVAALWVLAWWFPRSVYKLVYDKLKKSNDV